MKRFRAAKKLDAFDTKVDGLEAERRALEIQVLGAEVTGAERRARYFGIADPDLRRKAIAIERDLHDLRQQQRSAAIEYWRTVSAETRAKLDDLRSDSPTAGWRRDMWLDALTLLWILGGAGWLVSGIPGALGGTALTAAGAWFIFRSRRRTRPLTIRQGEDTLRSSERELHDAEHETAPAVFSASEAATGTPDSNG